MGIEKSNPFRLTPLALAILAASHAKVALAEEQEDVGIEEIIVTATKRESDLQDVGQSITAFTSEDIEKIGMDSMRDYVRALPSLSLQSTTPGRNQLVVRGISSGFEQFRTDSQVAVYLDEQPMTTISQQVGPNSYDLERIELLPGPQGTLFGSSSQTGTMRMITNKPDTSGFSGGIEASYGSTKGGEDSNEFAGHLNIPLSDDIAMRIVGYRKDHGGYVDNVLGSSLNGNFDNSAVAGDDFNEWELEGGRVALQWDINDNWTTLLSYITEDGNTTGSWETDPFLGEHRITRFIEEFREDDWYSAALTVTGDLGFAELTVSYAHFERDIAYEFDNNAYSQQRDRAFYGLYFELYFAGDPNYVNYPFYPLYYNNYYENTIVNDQFQERDSLEVRLTSQSDSKFHWMVGAYYEDVYDTWFYFTRVPNFPNTTAFAAANAYAYYAQTNPAISYPLAPTDIGYSNTLDRTVEQTAVFGEFGYDLTDQVTVIGGFRWAEFDRDEFEVFAFPNGLPGFTPNEGFLTTGDFRGQGKNDDTIYKFAVEYQIDDEKMVYALFSQGFRLGGQNSQRAADTGLVPLEYDPDFLNNFEVGIKSRWLNNTLQINASLFLMEWDDYQSETFSIDGIWWLNGKVNAEGAESTGLEMNVEWQATENLNIVANVFLANPEFTDDFEDPVNPGTLLIRDGMPMPGSPEERAYVGVTYNWPNVFGGDLWMYADVSYQAESWNDTANIIADNRDGLADSWTYSNLSVGWEHYSNGWSATLLVENLTDTDSYSWVNTFDNNDAEIFGDPRWRNMISIDRPRTAWFSIKKTF